MARPTLQQAIDAAPPWATHISVEKYNGLPEYYNTLDGDCLSLPVNNPNGAPVTLGVELSIRLRSGDSVWELVEIVPESLLNE